MLRDLTDAIAQLNAHRAPKVEIRVDDTATIIKAIERAGIPLVDRKPTEPVTGGAFMGVPIVVDRALPPGFAVIKQGDEVLNVLDLRAKEQQP